LKVRPTLEVRLIGGERALHLRIELDDFAQPMAATLGHPRSDRQPSWTKVFGRYLTPYLETKG
jgi:hypothetical protein